MGRPKWKHVGPADEAYGGDCRWVNFFQNIREPDFTYWAKPLDRVKPLTCNKWEDVDENPSDPKNPKIVSRKIKLWHFIQYKVVEHDKRTGLQREMTPTVSRGEKRDRTEAQFDFRHFGRTTAGRLCAQIWGNGDKKWMKGKKLGFLEFMEFGEEGAYKKYHSHHLPYRGGAERPDHAVPYECVITLADTHRRVHGTKW